MEVKVADWVTCVAGPSNYVGSVKRVAKDGSWADVDWHTHSKRMRTEYLRVEHTIPFMGGMVTDETRNRELAAE